MSGAGLAVAPALDGLLLRLPRPGIVRLYPLGAEPEAGRHAATWGADLDRRHAWIPAAALVEAIDPLLVLDDGDSVGAWRLPAAHTAWRTPLADALLRAALVMRSDWEPEAWTEPVGFDEDTHTDAVTRLLVVSGCAPDDRAVAAAVAMRTPGRERQMMQRAIQTAGRIGRETPGTDALLGALASALGVEAPPWRAPDVATALGLAPEWRDGPMRTLRRAWRGTALQHHPDHGGSAARFREVQDAWEHAQAEHRRHAHLRTLGPPSNRGQRGLWGQEVRVWAVRPAVELRLLGTHAGTGRDLDPTRGSQSLAPLTRLHPAEADAASTG